MNRRPVFFAIHRIALPVGAVASFLHRISGVLMVLALPLAAEVFVRSLSGADGVARVAQWLDGWPIRLALVVLAWALGHHLLAGIRHLGMDAGVGWRLPQARRSAAIAIAGGAVAALIAVWALA